MESGLIGMDFLKKLQPFEKSVQFISTGIKDSTNIRNVPVK